MDIEITFHCNNWGQDAENTYIIALFWEAYNRIALLYWIWAERDTILALIWGYIFHMPSEGLIEAFNVKLLQSNKSKSI